MYCCYKQIEKLKASIMKRENYILTQFTLYYTQQTKVSAFLSNLDKKLNTLLRHSRSAIPLPNLPTPFIDFLQLKTMNNLDLVEQILKPESENSNFNCHAE